MPRCQRTFRYLGQAVRGTWRCPFCSQGEVYDVVSDRKVWQYARWAQQQAVSDFGAPRDANRRFLLLNGLRPECILEPGDARYDVYLASGSDGFQQRLQIGHELFHRVAGEGQVFHWTQEMLACVFSVRLLHLAGYAQYAQAMATAYAEKSVYYPLSEFLAATPWDTVVYPKGYYGRAYVTGVALEKIVGYETLCGLARTLSRRTGQPDVNAWLESLNEAERNGATVCLSHTL